MRPARFNSSAICAPEEPAPTNPDGASGIYSLFGEGVEVFEDGDFIVLRSTGVPDHTSPYFGVGHPLYAAYDGDNPSFRQNPNGIAEQDLELRVGRSKTSH